MRIHGKIQHQFPPLRGVGKDGPKVNVEIHPEVDALAEQNPEGIGLC